MKLFIVLSLFISANAFAVSNKEAIQITLASEKLAKVEKQLLLGKQLREVKVESSGFFQNEKATVQLKYSAPLGTCKVIANLAHVNDTDEQDRLGAYGTRLDVVQIAKSCGDE